MKTHLNIITRTSLLARWQANFVRERLLQLEPTLSIDIIGIQTTADQWQDIPLYKMGGKSLFVKELEHALLEGKADIAVHSLKDMPATLPEGLALAAVLTREDPRDAWISPFGKSLQELPTNARIGTSSLRRMVQLKKIRSDLQYIPLRGNVDTRIKKCHQGEFDGIVLAMAGLTRLNLLEHVTSSFDVDTVLPAVGQGALGIECRSEDVKTTALLSRLEDPITRACVIAERTMNALLGGSCQIPIAGYAQATQEGLYLRGRVGDPETGIILSAAHRSLTPKAAGEKVAQFLLDQGAQIIIDKCNVARLGPV